MSERNITLTKASFVTLLDMLLPNPDDPNSPIGPVTLAGFINPAILALLSRGGVQPEPWRPALVARTTLVARTVIDQAIGQFRSAEMISSGDTGEQAFEAARASIREFVDDYCGTVPRRWPLPHPWPLTPDPIPRDHVDLLVAGVQFYKAADAVAGTPLQQDFVAAADQLLDTGIKQMECG